jgi:magnesium-transporting ATPase (P-type)
VNGLSSKRAEELLQEHGPNVLQKAESKPVLDIVLEQVNVLNMLVAFGGLLCVIQGRFTIRGVQFGAEPDYVNGGILFAIVSVCIFVGAYMEWKCSGVMADVSHMAARTCIVIRDSCQQSIDAERVVPGDIVVLRTGDSIPADCIVSESIELQTNEIALTGEPYDIAKTMQPKDLTSPFPSNLLFSSTGVVNGTGKGIVLKTGMKTEIGKIAALLGEQETGLTSVQRTLNMIGNMITLVVLALTLGIFTVSYHMKVNDPSDPSPKDDDLCFLQKSIMRALFAAVGAIPESLQPACTFLLVMGCSQMKSLNASTVKLAAVDTLGSCSFIASDKTGTLTEGKMTLMQLRLRCREKVGAAVEMGTLAFYPTRGFDPRGGIFHESRLTKQAKVALDDSYEVQWTGTPGTIAVSRKMIFPGEEKTFDLPEDLGDPANQSKDAKLARSCMYAAFLNSHGTTLVAEDAASFAIQGNMSEGALVVGAAKARISGSESHTTYERIPKVELPFSSSRKMMATVHRLPEDGRFEHIQFDLACKYVAIMKGAPEVLLPRLSRVLTSNDDGSFTVSSNEFNDDDKSWFQEQNDAMSKQALRVLCIVMRPLTAQDFDFLLEAESNTDERSEVLMQGPLLLVGLVGLMDPPRASARLAVQACHQAGVRVAMITGDQTQTAVAVARSLGILPPVSKKENNSLRVSECNALHMVKGSESRVDELCSRVVVWSRAQPTDKVTIVDSLQRQSHIVAMTGDGVNDAGALKKADVGLAMGIAGTDVTKNAADMILMDDRFATIIDACAEGRRIFENIQRLSAYLLCCNIFDVLVMMSVMALGWAVPLEQSQLFKANFVTHMFYPWCMVFEPANFYNMQHPPRSRDKHLLPSLTRKFVIPCIFAAYFVLMHIAQYTGSMIYLGAVARDEQTGTSSITDFYSPEKNYVCLYANTMKVEKKLSSFAKTEGSGDTPIYIRDAAPLHCRVRKLTWSGWKVISEWGHEQKADPDVAILSEPFDWFTGSWGGLFDIKNSFLAESFHSGAQDFQGDKWEDQKGWLGKCSDIKEQGSSGEEISGENDLLCWKKCGNIPCWEQDLENQKGAAAKALRRPDDEDEPTMKPVLYKKFNAGAWGCRQMRSLVLMSLVLIEFTMLFSFSKHDFSLPLIGRNVAFPIAWVPMLGVLLSYVYLPVYSFDQGFAPLDSLGVLIALSVVLAFYIAFELTKWKHRRLFEDELREKTVLAQLLSEGRLHAFASREEAWIRCPSRRPLTADEKATLAKYGPAFNYGSTESAGSSSSGLTSGSDGENAV